MSRKKTLLTIEQFDENDTVEPVFQSPRTIEALRRQGIEPSELSRKFVCLWIYSSFSRVVRTVENFMSSASGFSGESRQRMFEHFEQRRLGISMLAFIEVISYFCLEKIRIIREERQALIEEGWLPASPKPVDKSRRSVATVSGVDDSSLVQRVCDSILFEFVC